MKFKSYLFNVEIIKDNIFDLIINQTNRLF